MSQAYTTIDDWKMCPGAFEKFSEIVTSLHSPQSQQLDHGQIEQFLNTEGGELLRRLFQGYLDYRADTEPDWESSKARITLSARIAVRAPSVISIRSLGRSA